MELLIVGEQALKVKLSPSRILEKARCGQILRIKLGTGPKSPIRFDLEAVLKTLQGNNDPVVSE